MYNGTEVVCIHDLKISVSKKILNVSFLKALSPKVKLPQLVASIVLNTDSATLTNWRTRGRGPKTFRRSSNEHLYEVGDLLRWVSKNELQSQKYQTPEALEVWYGRSAFEWRCTIVNESLGIIFEGEIYAYTGNVERHVSFGGLGRAISPLSYDEAFAVLSLHFQLKMDDSEALIKPLMKAIPRRKTVSVNQLKSLASNLNLERKKYDR